MMRFVEHLYNNIVQNKLLSKGDKVILAVSGGADSVALMHGFFALRSKMGFTLIIAHFDHNLRKSSVRDQRFVMKEAAALSLPFFSKVNEMSAPLSGSIEEFARNQRYEFLCSLARQENADAVVTAHTLDDLAETVLMRVMRGTGLAGLQAILPRRLFCDIPLIRPMLSTTRKEVELFLSEINKAFVNDPTNSSLDFTRNKVRKMLLPMLIKEFHPAIKENLARLAATSAVDYEYLDSQAKIVFSKNVRRIQGGLACPLISLRKEHPAIRRAVIRLLFVGVSPQHAALSLAHVETVNNMISNNKVSGLARRSLPMDIDCRVENGQLRLRLI